MKDTGDGNFGRMDRLDLMIAAALRSCAEPVPGFDLASEAVRRGKAYAAVEVRLARMARVRMWARISTVAAGLLLTATVVVAYRFWPAAVGSDASSADTVTSAVSFGWTTVGIVVLLTALIGVVGAALFAGERSQVRFMAG